MVIGLTTLKVLDTCSADFYIFYKAPSDISFQILRNIPSFFNLKMVGSSSTPITEYPARISTFEHPFPCLYHIFGYSYIIDGC